MATDNSIKATYSKNMWGFVAVHTAIAWSIAASGALSGARMMTAWQATLDERSIVFGLLPIVTLILNGIIPTHVKEILVFWRLKNPLPGCRAFSQLAPKDPKVDPAELRRRYGEFPQAPEEQNRLWYQIYKNHRDNPAIMQGLRAYLMSRDLAGISFCLLFLGVVFVVITTPSRQVAALYLGTLVIQYLLLALTARFAGDRLVCNSLAQNMASPHEKGERLDLDFKQRSADK
jgi:hypothetical protein